MRVRNEEHVHDWFVRCIDDLGGQPELCRMEDNIAVFGTVAWKDDGMTFCRIQTLCSLETDLEEFYCVPDKPYRYYRLELDPCKPGPLFKEPLPHLHVQPRGEPRVAFAATSLSTFIPDFLEFIYLNHAYDKWLEWAREVWEKKSGLSPLEDPFPRLIAGFQTGNIRYDQPEIHHHLNRLRKILLSERSDFRWDITEDVLNLNYAFTSA